MLLVGPIDAVKVFTRFGNIFRTLGNKPHDKILLSSEFDEVNVGISYENHNTTKW